ncbi:MAG: TRAP transporter small permease [Planctomycetes bacterium]|nr:TRAP transporter small permease [Planctomycetota bacterium]
MLRRFLGRIEDYLAAVVLLVMVLLAFAQVVSRHFLPQSLSFTEEIVRYLLIWATMLGAASATRRKAHLGLVYLSRVRPELKRYTDIIGQVALIALFTVVFVSNIFVICLQVGQRTEGLRWPIIWVSISVSVGSALIVIRAVQVLLSGPSEEEG